MIPYDKRQTVSKQSKSSVVVTTISVLFTYTN